MILIPIPLPEQVLQASSWTSLLSRSVLRTGLGMGMGMNGTAHPPSGRRWSPHLPSGPPRLPCGSNSPGSCPCWVGFHPLQNKVLIESNPCTCRMSESKTAAREPLHFSNSGFPPDAKRARTESLGEAARCAYFDMLHVRVLLLSFQQPSFQNITTPQ